MSPPTRRSARGAGPGAETAAATISKLDHQQDSRVGRQRQLVVTVEHSRFRSAVRSPSKTVTELIKRVVPVRSREYDPRRRVWLVFGSRIGPLLVALRAAGVTVHEDGAA